MNKLLPTFVELAEDIWLLVRDFIPEDRRQDLARKVIDRFEADDADTMDEAETLYRDARPYFVVCKSSSDYCPILPSEK